MARQPRFFLPGHPQHVIQRGNNRDVIFVDSEDYEVYLETLGACCRRFGCAVHAYVCMTNHVHLLMTPATDTAISQVMQALGRKYVQYFNYRYQRTGTLWEGRFKASLIEAEAYLLTCYRYIELNPVRAAMVDHPAGYPWSSYHHNASGKADDLVAEHPLYGQLAADPRDRQAAYRALFSAHIPMGTVEVIRAAANKDWALGNNRFCERIESLLGRQAAPRRRGGDRKSKHFQGKQAINRV